DYVKPHGALYNQAAVDESLADILVSEIQRFDPNLKVMGLSGGHLVAAAKRQGLVSISEVFADRNYEKDGSLVSRSKDSALITDTQAAIDHVLQMITQGTVTSVCGEVVPVEAESICLHGDGAHAILFAREIKKQLEQKGITISAQ
ncbi:LamB/YcsF family protein, partial [Psychrobacter sp. 1Y4]|uniref:LamB/YcsF family protein n=1 Tax=Psychrobacter sp. 1Y4 TaxID=3453575 RepID=UPI003F462159